MPNHSISCADCLKGFTARRSNAKYCPACRLYRDLLFIKDSTQECWVCDQKFSPTKKGMVACAPCGEHQFTRRAHCAFCDQDDRPMLMPDLAVCTHCAFDPTNRRRLIKSVAHRITLQKEAVHV